MRGIFADLVVDVAVDQRRRRRPRRARTARWRDDASGEGAERGSGMTSRWGHGTEGRPIRGAATTSSACHGAAGRRYREPVRRADTVASGLLARLPPRRGGAAVCRRGDHTVVGVDPDEVVVAHGADGSRGARPLGARVLGRLVRVRARARVERVVAAAASLDDAVGARRRVRPVRRRSPWSTRTARSPSAATAPGRPAARARGARRASTATARAPAPIAAASGGWRTSLDRDDYEATASRRSSSCSAPASATR